MLFTPQTIWGQHKHHNTTQLDIGLCLIHYITTKDAGKHERGTWSQVKIVAYFMIEKDNSVKSIREQCRFRGPVICGQTDHTEI